MSSIFTKIIAGDLPCYKIYENDFSFVFLTIEPIHLGHSLIVPKVEVNKFYDVPAPYYQDIFSTAKIIAPAIEKATGCLRVGSSFVGLEVPHCHMHLIPLWDSTDMLFSKSQKRSDQEMLLIQKKIIDCIDYTS